MKKIAIIKLGALGDVIRTLPLAAAIKNKFPESEIIWITSPKSADIVKSGRQIDRVLTSKPQEKFDILYNFDTDSAATEMASQIEAEEKYGFCSNEGFVSAFNLGAEYYLNTLFDDELKKSNKKTYQEMMFEAAELPYERIFYKIKLSNEEINFGKNFLEKNKISGKKIIGIHIGSSPRWPSKAWSEEKIKEFIAMAKNERNEIILFGGPDETQRHKDLIAELQVRSINVFSNNPQNTLREFASLLNICDAVICSDSLALHLAIGLNKPTIGLFFCTSPDEVESYGLLKKIVSPLLYDFFPERMNEFNEELINSITAEDVFAAFKEINKTL